MLCDNNSVGTDSDGKIILDLTQQESLILNGQSESNFLVSYYTDAALTKEILAPKTYTNTFPKETIYVKVYHKENPLCMASRSFEIEVYTVPTVADTAVLKQCDDDNDGFTVFNLEEAIPKINTNHTTESVQFFRSLTDAQNNSNPIINTTTYINKIVSSDKVYARVSNTNNCFKLSQLDLVVSATQVPASFYRRITVCDDDQQGSYTDGISTFDFSAVTEALRKDVFPAGQLLNISYYTTIDDALAEKNPIQNVTQYRNTNSPHSQKIYIRVDSQTNNDCVGLGNYLTLHVEPLPLAEPLTIAKCDDNNDGIFSFDTTLLQTQLLGGLSNVDVIYFDQNNNALPSPLPNPFVTATQTINVHIKSNTGSSCSYETTITFRVDNMPEAFALNPNLTTVCDDEEDPLLQDGKYPFDTSTFQSTILGNQGGMLIRYFDSSDHELPSPLPNPFITGTQVIRAEVTNPANPDCYASTLIPFVLHPLPKINLKGTDALCSNIPALTKEIDAGLMHDNTENDYNYTWFLNGTLIPNENSSRLIVNEEGIYSVQVSDKMTQCSKTRTIDVAASDIAQITNLDIVDLEDANSITVTVNGSGNYVFALDDTEGEYQSENIFHNVPPGIHMVYVKDLNGCGIVSKEAAVLGIPKFFTPNEDGYNDYWTIKGVTASAASNTIIQIFDRYGKLLKQFNALNQGWDGYSARKQMPADDYWYVVKLENEKLVKGHFTLKR